MTDNKPQAGISIQYDEHIIYCSGAWTLAGITDLTTKIEQLCLPTADQLVVSGARIDTMDSAGAWLLQKCITQLEGAGKSVSLQNLNSKYQDLFLIVQKAQESIKALDVKSSSKAGIAQKTGELVYRKAQESLGYFDLIGQFSLALVGNCFSNKKFQWRSLIAAMDKMGYQALPIIALLSFLIGVVLAYQMALQLQTYGANIFIVNFSGIAILREFAPLITAIIVAGRTSSSITAQLGMMQLNEEIDALKTMGLSPIDYLVVPRILALIIVMPLLTFWADIFGVLGSMVMAEHMLGLSYHDFLHRFQSVIEVRHYTVGLVKTPVFAFIIASIGCHRGFQVHNDAASVGKQTTASVVQAIFLIIVADAGFSVIFSWADI